MTTETNTPCSCPTAFGSVDYPCPAHPPSLADALRHAVAELERSNAVMLREAGMGVTDQRVIDAGRAALAAAEAQPSPTAGMNIAQRILHVGGRDNAAGYIEFGSIQAVEALVRHVLRDQQQPVAVPQGWKLVPLETTCEMNCAAFDAYQATRHAGEIWRAMLAAAPAAPAPEHPDEEAVDRFAGMLKAKLAKAREKGRSGWADPAWPAADINRQMHEHAAKGDPLDVAAYAMFLALRGEAATGAPAPAGAAIWQWLTADGGSICERWQAISERWDGSDGRVGIEAAAVAAMRAHGIGGKA